MDDGPVWSVDGTAFLQLFDEGLGQAVARAQLHGAQDWLRLGCPQVVVLQVPIAILVEHIAAFRASGFGNQDAGKGQAGWMVLDKFHILQRRARLVRQCHAVAVLDVGIGREGEHPTTAPRA